MPTLRLTEALSLLGGLTMGDGTSTHVRISTTEAYSGVGTATFGAPRIVLGSNTPIAPQDDSCILICRKLIGTSLFSHGIRDESTFSSTLDSAYCSFDSAVTLSGATAYNHVRSFQARTKYTGSGSLAMANGFQWNFSHTGAGTVDLCYGGLIQNPLGAGPINTNVGIQIEALTRGSVANFSINSVGAATQGYHAGKWQIGSGGLQVDGGGASITGLTTIVGTIAHTGSMASSGGLNITGGALQTGSGVTVTIASGVHAQCLTAKGTVDSFDAGGTVLQYLGGGTGSVRVYGANTGLSGTSFAVNLNGTDYVTVTPTTVTVAAALFALTGQTTGTTAPAAGGAGALPATPLGYWSVALNGTTRKIAYYA